MNMHTKKEFLSFIYDILIFIKLFLVFINIKNIKKSFVNTIE